MVKMPWRGFAFRLMWVIRDDAGEREASGTGWGSSKEKKTVQEVWGL